jgi:hypothetical protein
MVAAVLGAGWSGCGHPSGLSCWVVAPFGRGRTGRRSGLERVPTEPPLPSGQPRLKPRRPTPGTDRPMMPDTGRQAVGMQSTASWQTIGSELPSTQLPTDRHAMTDHRASGQRRRPVTRRPPGGCQALGNQAVSCRRPRHQTPGCRVLGCRASVGERWGASGGQLRKDQRRGRPTCCTDGGRPASARWTAASTPSEISSWVSRRLVCPMGTKPSTTCWVGWSGSTGSG